MREHGGEINFMSLVRIRCG